ncbi:DUF3445 domain-containing protein [Acuticoccus sp. MNP-M23]|uniref:heme-dependent oxidative N-demethylase family protein n=1 Tax=Acuticoccus sp. MNP-M23 TaxID=3072793 RepID=UPI002815F7D6|nr:DUF3445 domain-containing protein [Acuticoccus sp. MNP-M23]WMS44192.1 DUF3445 domain-containing protein [Acuticoccus sp. MNP-M23]
MPGAGAADRPRPRHTPYAGRHRPFTIAMAPLDPANWLEIDENREAELAERAAIFAAEPDAFMAARGTLAAQEEAADRVAAFLATGGILPGPSTLPHTPPLLAAAHSVQEDLVLMRRGPDGEWRLAAAALAYPSAWILAEKFGQPMDAIHTDVPGWAGPMATRVHRIFDALKVGAPVWRLNWSIQRGGGLRDARSKHRPAPPPPPDAPALIRVERQTLTRLPVSQDLLFTIKVCLDPLAALSAHPDGPHLAGALAARLRGLSADELAYKNLAPARDDLAAELENLAGSAPA